MAWPEDALTDGETIIVRFRPHWKVLVAPVLVTVGLILAVLVVWIAVPFPAIVEVLVTVGLLGLLLATAGRAFVAWATTHYVLTTERLITRRGLIAREGVEIPLENINDVNFSQSILERLLGAGDLLIESAGEVGQSRFSDIPHPDRFQALVYKVREERAMALGGAGDRRLDPVERLERLTRLHQEGVLSDEEFEEKRRKLLDEI